MRHRLRIAALAAGLTACNTGTTVPTPAPVPAAAPGAGPGYTAFVTGSTTDAVTVPVGGALLAGGGTDNDAGMQWLLAQGGTRAPNQFGDVVVLRTSGGDGYNAYLMKLGANSVTSIVIKSVTGANSTFVRDAIANAEVVFIAGGDQSTYVSLWRGTALQAAVNAKLAAGYPIGGTSAGLAVLSEHVYSALNVSARSATVLANPYDTSATFARALFTVPLLSNVITDTHFVPRDRLGRTVAFLARLQQDGAATAPRAIAVDEGSAIGVTATGAGTVFGAATSKGAYFFSVPATTTRICQAGTPLTLSPVTAVHIPVGKAFNVSTWTTSDAVPYTISAAGGTLTSSTGSIY